MSPPDTFRKLVFVVPLQSPEVSRNWPLVSRLATGCIGSILNQSHPAFHAILVCNRRPENLLVHPRLTVIEESFPIPDGVRLKRIGDKYRKIHRGLVEARQFAPCPIMRVDADDRISSHLAGWVASHFSPYGWIVNRGYVHDIGSRWFYAENCFHLRCGTSHVIHVGPGDLPQDMDDNPDNIELLKWGHHIIKARMEATNRPLLPIPFRPVVYMVGTGDNDSGFSLKGWRSKKIMLKKLLGLRPLTARLRREFLLGPS